MGSVDTRKKASPIDWHAADVVAAIRKAGWSLRRLSRQHGYADQSLQLALRKPWPRAERIIGEAIGVPPQRIWPSRYHRDGTPKSGRGERGLGRGAKRSTASTGSNVQLRGAR